MSAKLVPMSSCWVYGAGKAIVGRVHKPTNTAKGTTLHDSTLGKLSWFLGWYADYIFSLGFTPNYYTVNLGSSQCNDFLPGKPTKTWANAVMHIPTLNEDDFPYLSSHGEPIIEVHGESAHDINQTWGKPRLEGWYQAIETVRMYRNYPYH